MTLGFRVLSALVSSAMAITSFAFDSEVWHTKREAFSREAERLRSAYSNCASRATSPAEDLKLPVETYPDGSVKTIVNAKRAQFFAAEHLIWAEGVDVRRLDRNGKVESSLECERCVIDQNARSGWSEGAARVVHEGTELKGRGVYFAATEKYAQVLADAEIRTDELKVRDRNAKARAHVTSRRCDYDGLEGVAMFEGAVRIEYGKDYAMNSERLHLFFAKSGEISRAVADGGVKLANGERTGSCATATYRHRRREVEMFSGADGRVAELADGGNRLKGKRIRFWLDSEQVEVERPELSVDTKGKAGLKSL